MTDTSIAKSSLSEVYGAFIDNEFRSASRTTFPARAAASGEYLADIARCDANDIDDAVASAKAAFPAWKAATPEDRAACLNKLADVIERETSRLMVIDTMDIGRGLWETEIDYSLAVQQYRYFAAAALTHEGFGRPIADGYLLAKREPYGVCGQIIPWNVPAIMAALKIAPAVAAGNTVVLKPDENASLSTLELGKLIADIFPPGVINIVPGMGEEVGASLTAHPDVAKLAFTGSSEVGRIVSHAGSNRLIPVSLELGGKSPNIIFPDIGTSDIDAIVDNVTFGSMYCNGQSCLAGTRLFLHDAIYDEFMQRLLASMQRIRVIDPMSQGPLLGCLVSEKQGHRVQSYIDIGRKEASLVTGGNRIEVSGCAAGWFFEPTVFETSNDTRIAQEEIFGPVLSVIRWNDYEKMIHDANNVRYGLASGIYTNNLKSALDTADRLQAGNVWINNYFNLAAGSPFGGFKESGIGSEFCHETLNMYTHLKAITVQTQVNPAWYAT
ncbi:MAG: aldehyde dehydrogenase family protein [Chromatiales bacterium]|nr:aldehyde dehydrogenase family protein [Chromatiales bacterium]